MSDRMRWWAEAKFGMFIHWGLYSILAGVWRGRCVPGVGEWIMRNARIPVREYEKLARRFNPVKFDAEEWARLAREAGMRYVVFTAKHHDGFCMYDSEYTGYTVVKATPFGRDVLGELADACRGEGLRFGAYYSQTLDWHHPDGMGNDWDYDPGRKDFARYFREYAMPQVEEILTKYKPVAVMWFDIGTPTPELAREMVGLVRRVSPDTIVSGRIGHGLGDYAEMGDNEIPRGRVEGYWEVPVTLNDTWGFKSYDHNWKSPGRVIQMFVDVVSKGGNMLLNVGPTAEGVIPEPSAEVLRAVGRWLERCGESVYGTVPGPLDAPPDAPYRCTAKPGRVYVHVLAWPWDGELRVFGARGRVEVSRAYLLEGERELEFRWDGDDLVVAVPDRAPDPVDSVVVLECEW